MDKTKPLIKSLKKFKGKIFRLYKPEKIIFFGSRAEKNKNLKKDSDVDLIIVSKKFEKVKALKRSPDLYMKWDLDYPVDFLCYTPEEFEKLKNRITIVRHAVEEGIEI